MITLHSLDDFPENLRGGTVAIGNFDGVHLGHARLVERLAGDGRPRWRAGRGVHLRSPADADPAPRGRPRAADLGRSEGRNPRPSWASTPSGLSDRPALLELEAREFFDRIVRGRLAARAMVEGPNFFFGHNRRGNVEVLRRFCEEANMPFEVAEPVEIDGQIVSSSRIRESVLAGRMDEARAMLGRPYRIRGTVVRGAGRGRQLGYPTANVGEIDTLLPGEGIYAARAWVDGVWHAAAVSRARIRRSARAG